MASRRHALSVRSSCGSCSSLLDGAAALPVRNTQIHQQPLTSTTETIGASQDDSGHFNLNVDTNTIVIGTNARTSGTIQATTRLVEEDQPARAYVIPSNPLQQYLLTPGGRRLCFGIVVVLVLGALGAVALGILCGGAVICKEPPTQYLSTAVPTETEPLLELEAERFTCTPLGKKLTQTSVPNTRETSRLRVSVIVSAWEAILSNALKSLETTSRFLVGKSLDALKILR
jgi:hypothetical protein